MYTLMILTVLLNGWTNITRIELNPVAKSFEHITLKECLEAKEMLIKQELKLKYECIKDKE